MPRVSPLPTNGIEDLYNGKTMLALGIRGNISTPCGFGEHTNGISQFGDDRYFGGCYVRRKTGYNNTGYKPHLPKKTYYVRMRHSVPTNPNTQQQQERRSLFAEAMQSWKNLPQAEKSDIIKKAVKAGRRPHNFYVSQYMRNNIAGA